MKRRPHLLPGALALFLATAACSPQPDESADPGQHPALSPVDRPTAGESSADSPIARSLSTPSRLQRHPDPPFAIKDTPEEKAKHIIIPGLKAKEARLDDLLHEVHRLSRKHDTITTDPSKKGINIICMISTEARITLLLTDIDLHSVLRYLATAADYRVRWGQVGAFIEPRPEATATPEPTPPAL